MKWIIKTEPRYEQHQAPLGLTLFSDKLMPEHLIVLTNKALHEIAPKYKPLKVPNKVNNGY